MSGEFLMGLFYGVLCGALPLALVMAWDANRRVQEHLHRAIEEGRREGRVPAPCGVYPPPPAPPHPRGVPGAGKTVDGGM